MRKKNVLVVGRASIALLCIGIGASLGAQDNKVDENRVDTILNLIDQRAMVETDSSFDNAGDYPRAIQLLRMRSRLLPHYEDVLTNLTWMLGNVHQPGEAITEAMRFRAANPDSADRSYPLAQLYYEMKLYAKIPAILEEDILRVPTAHPNLFRLIGHSYAKMGFHKDSLRVWETYLKSHPEDAGFLRLQKKATEAIGSN